MDSLNSRYSIPYETICRFSYSLLYMYKAGNLIENNHLPPSKPILLCNSIRIYILPES